MKSLIYTLLFSFFTAILAFGQTDTLSFAKPQKLPNAVNSTAEESLPIIGADGKTLYFTRTYHPGNKGGADGAQDIWQSSRSASGYSNASNLNMLNTAVNDAVVGSARAGKRIYLLNKPGEKKGTSLAGVSRCDYNEAEAKWGEITPVTVPELEVEGNFYSAFVGPNEDFILWSLPGNGVDTTNNLYVSLSRDQGESWTAPQALGSINSGLDDISPFYDSPRKLLFWSSNGRDGYGNYDVYYARRLNDSWSDWSAPVNAGPEINSTDFDAYFFAESDGTAWLSSNRGDSLSNIYLSSLVITTVDDEVAEEELAVSDTIAQTISEPQKDPVLIIDTKDGTSTDRSLSDLSLKELLDKDTHIRFVYFPYDKYNITAKYIEVLDDVASILDEFQQLNVLIEGHTDNVGSTSYNAVLSENRAQSTKEYLLIHGLDDGRIRTKAYGKTQPYATNETEDGRALNRRVELYFSK
jgi:outer membrane protein OmpA-like peptidoglycan-associated protein